MDRPRDHVDAFRRGEKHAVDQIGQSIGVAIANIVFGVIFVLGLEGIGVDPWAAIALTVGARGLMPRSRT